MQPLSEIEIDALIAERDKYKKMAAQELRTSAMKQAFVIAAKAFAEEIVKIPADEREALEAQLGASIEVALATGVRFTLENQAIFVKRE